MAGLLKNGHHDSSSSDEPMANLTASSSCRFETTFGRVGHPPLQELLRRTGPPALAVVIGTPKGRWTSELTACTGAGKEACAVLQNAIGGDGDLNRFCGQLDEGNVVAGIAVIESWKFMHDAPSHDQTYALMAASRAYFRQRTGGRFLEHKIIASATVHSDIIRVAHTNSVLAGQPAYVGQQLLREIIGADFVASVSSGDGEGEGPLKVKQVVSAWEAVYGVSQDRVVAWTIWAPLAFAVARGAWFGDVTALHRRDAERVSSPPILPSSRALRAFKASANSFVLARPASAQLQHRAPFRARVFHTRPGAIRRYTAEHMINSVRASRGLANQGKAKSVAKAALRFWYPEDWQTRAQLKDNAGHQVPSRKALRLARVRFDIACMLHRRQWYANHIGSTFRYVGFDASPQRPGIEVFATVERVVARRDVLALPCGQLPRDAEVRRFPLSALGHSKASLPDKLQAHVHQVWLEYGPSVEQVRTANLDVRQCLTDMGTEWGIADCADVVAQCVGQGQPPFGHSGFLYPLALAVPGPQHIIDGILKEALHCLEWWPAWQKQAKVVCQWLSKPAHREYLQSRLRHAGMGIHCKALDNTIDRFAQWRWKTLASVTSGLASVENAVRAFTQGATSITDLVTRDATTARIFWDASMDPLFWGRASGLNALSKTLTSLSGWIRGCDCHEAERLAGRQVTCKWAGCRARSFAARLRSARQELFDMRARAANDRLRGVDCNDQIATLTRMLAVFNLKFSWVFEPPYSIWEARWLSIKKLRYHFLFIV